MKFFKKIIWWMIILIILISGGFYGYQFFKNKKPKQEYSTFKVIKSDLIQTVSSTGIVKPISDFNLTFKIAGTISEINIKKGSSVKQGQILAKLESSNLKIQIKEAQTDLKQAQANLILKLAGESKESIKIYEVDLEKAKIAFKKAQLDLENLQKTTKENIKQAEIKIDSVKISLDQANKNLKNTKTKEEQNIINAYNNARIALKNSSIIISTSLRDADYILGIDNKSANNDFEKNLGVLNSQSKQEAESAYLESKEKINSIDKILIDIDKADNNKINQTISSMETALNLTDFCLIKTRVLLDNTITSADLSQTELDNFKLSIDARRINVNTTTDSLEIKKQNIAMAELNQISNNDTTEINYQTAKNNLELANQNLNQIKIESNSQIKTAKMQIEIQKALSDSSQAVLDFKKADPRNVDIESLKAQIQKSQIAIDLILNNLNDTVLKAPIDGIITAVNFEKGETINPNQIAISMIKEFQKDGDLEIELDISETDISKIEINQIARLTFDALDDEKIFNEKIIFINPIETIIEGVVYYKVKINISNEIKSKFKSGMTVDAEIETAKKENVLIVPQRAIYEKETKKMVKVLEMENVIEKEIETGLSGDEGMVEILNGIKEGEMVIK